LSREIGEKLYSSFDHQRSRSNFLLQGAAGSGTVRVKIQFDDERTLAAAESGFECRD
jgi:hypothetical protein